MLMITFLEPGKKIVISTPSFAMYKHIASVLGVEVIEVPLNPDFSYDTLVFLSW